MFKIIFLLNCFPVNSKLTIWIYNTWLNIIRKYDIIITDFCRNVYDHIIESKKEIEEKRDLFKKNKKSDDIDYENENIGNLLKEKGSNMAFNLLTKIY